MFCHLRAFLVPGVRQADEAVPEQLRDRDPLHDRVQREEVEEERRHGNDRRRRKARLVEDGFSVS